MVELARCRALITGSGRGMSVPASPARTADEFNLLLAAEVPHLIEAVV
jgi:hypothetical protein